MDVARHNAEVGRLWAEYRAGRPARPPVTFSMNSRMVLLDPALNTARITPRRFFEDPAAMWDIELKFQKWLRTEVVQDAEMGPPAAWTIAPQWFNVYDAGWFGCGLFYPEDDVPDTRPMFQDRKQALYDTPLPDPLRGNLMGRALEFYEYFDDRRRRDEFEGRPIGPPWGPTGSDGPFTVACNLRGATELCEDLVEDPAYAFDLLEWVTTGIARRMRAWRARTGTPPPAAGEWTWFADDSIALLSPAAYREHVLPHHRRLLGEFRGGAKVMMHLCGNARHQFRTAVDELGVASFELGFPTDLGRARRDLGPDIELIGNIHPNLLRNGPPGRIAAAVRDVLASGAAEGGRLILRDGNNVAPGTPPAHFAAMYEAGRAAGGPSR